MESIQLGCLSVWAIVATIVWILTIPRMSHLLEMLDVWRKEQIQKERENK